MYLYVLVCIRMLLVCHSFITRMLLVCTRVLLYVLVCTRMYSYVTRMYSYVLVWCFSHDQKTSVTEKVLSLNERRKFTTLNRAI